MFEPRHLQGASTELVQSMFKIGRTAAQLERQKLQMEIQKEQSERRRKRLEKRLQMASKGGKGSPAKIPKKMKRELELDDNDDNNFLEDLVTTTETDNGQPSYSTLETGGFVTKGADRKTRLDKRHAKIAAATGKPDEGEIEETAQEKLEREASELTSQLKKAERAEAQAQEKEQKEKAKCYSQRIMSGKFLKKPKAVMLVETKK